MVDLSKLLTDIWEYQLRENPLIATFYGDYRYNDRLPSLTEDDFARQMQTEQTFWGQLQQIDSKQLSTEELINYELVERLLRDQIADYNFKSYLMPVSNHSGFHVSFPELPKHTPLHKQVDYENYIARLQAFKLYTEQHIELMRIGIKQGYVVPKVVLANYQHAINAQIVERPQDSRLYKPFAQNSLHIKSWKELQKQAQQAISDSVVPAYKLFLEFMSEEYVPAARDDIAASSLPNGREYYAHVVKHFTTLNISPEEVHQIGLDEVNRIKKEMDSVIDKLEFKGSFREFVQFLATDSRFYVDTPQQLLKEASLILKKMDGELPRLFKTLPRMSYGIREVPDYVAQQMPTAYYMPPAGDGSRGGYYYVNTSALEGRPLYELEALSFHEAVPGHHLQIALQQELTNLPPLRRFTMFHAYIEGWALYAEHLGLEIGFYQDPYFNFGRLIYEMWRACRLVVDTGMHWLNWSREQAIQYLQQYSALSLHNIQTEVDRYIAWPGQALSYKIGELKIKELRKHAQEQLGEAFDIREFHDVILMRGALPLDILERIVHSYVEKRKFPQKEDVSNQY